jgi:hypothetical protein
VEGVGGRGLCEQRGRGYSPGEKQYDSRDNAASLRPALEWEQGRSGEVCNILPREAGGCARIMR